MDQNFASFSFLPNENKLLQTLVSLWSNANDLLFALIQQNIYIRVRRRQKNRCPYIEIHNLF